LPQGRKPSLSLAMSDNQTAAPMLRLVDGSTFADQAGTRPTCTPKPKVTFKQVHLVRAVRAAQAAGLAVVATEVAPDGTIRLEHVGAPAESVPINPFDRWEAKRARAA